MSLHGFNKVSLLIVSVFPALMLLLLGEPLTVIVRIYLVPVLLFLIGFPWIRQQALNSRIRTLAYSIAIGIALVASVIFIISFIHLPYIRLSSILPLSGMVIFGSFRLYRSRWVSNLFDRSSTNHRLSRHYHFLVAVPVVLAVFHYCIYEVSLARSPLPAKPIVSKLPFLDSHKDELANTIDNRFIYISRYDLRHYLGRCELIDKYGLPIPNPLYSQSNTASYASKYQSMAHYMIFTYWIGLKRLLGLSAIQASKASAIVGYLLIFFAVFRISTLIGLSCNWSLFAGTASLIWGTLFGIVLHIFWGRGFLWGEVGAFSGSFSGYFYHNAPQLHSTGLGLSGLAMVLEYYEDRRPRWLYLAAFLIGSSLHFKPAFFTIIPFSLLFLFLISKQYRLREWYIFGAITIAFVVLWLLPKYLFPMMPSPMRIGFKPFHILLHRLWGSSFTTWVIISLFAIVSGFGILFLAANWTEHYLRKKNTGLQNARSAYLIMAVSLLLLGLFQYLSFYETGMRYYYGNFAWALYSAMPFCLPMVFLFYCSLKSGTLKALVALGFALHLASGIAYSVTYPRYWRYLYIDDVKGLQSLEEMLDVDARGISLGSISTEELYSGISSAAELYSGTTCFNMAEVPINPEYYSTLYNRTKPLETILEMINPDYIILDREKRWDIAILSAEKRLGFKIPAAIVGYFPFYSSEVSGIEIWLRKDYEKNGKTIRH